MRLFTVCPLPSLSSGGVEPLPKILSWTDFLSASVRGITSPLLEFIEEFGFFVEESWQGQPWRWRREQVRSPQLGSDSIGRLYGKRRTYRGQAAGYGNDSSDTWSYHYSPFKLLRKSITSFGASFITFSTRLSTFSSCTSLSSGIELIS